MTTSFSLASVYDQLTNFANLSNFWSLFNTAFGSSYDSVKAATFKYQWQNQNFSQFPQIEIVSNGVLGTANGAYAISTNRIYLSDAFISLANQQSLVAVILEEFGHFVDAQVNQTDTSGDEGELFSALVRGVNLSAAELSRIQTEDDHAVVMIGGEQVAIEQNEQLLFTDNFDNGTSSLWGNEVGNWQQTQGVYDSQDPSNSPLTYSSLPYLLKDFSIELDINKVQDGGVFLRSTDNNNGVVLVTGGLGRVGTGFYWHTIQNGVVSEILNHSASGLLQSGISNIHLRIEVLGDNYSAFLNDIPTPVTTLTTSLFSSGKVALYDFSYDSPGLQTFDNVKVYSDSPLITLAVAPTSVLEDGTPNLTYTFTRTGATTNTLTVNYTIAGTATNGTDYATIGTSVIFAANSATAIVTVNPTADTTIETNETVALTLATSTSYTVGTTTAVTGTITNDDPTITLAVAPTSVLEDGTPNLVYTLTRTGATTSALTVNYTIAGTATNGTDYATIGTSVIFAANSATAIVTVNPTADTTIEANETVALTLATSTSYTVGTTTAVTGTITNDDTTTTPTVTLALNYNGISENSPSNFTYTFTRTGVTTNALTVNYSIGGTATATDYIGATPGTGKTINFAVGSATATLNLDSIGDTSVETDETISLQLATGNGYTVGTTTAQIGTIINDDGTRRQKGTSGKDVILGTNLSDILSGGLGNDILTGSDGGDSFVFNATNEGTDTITDFSVGSDYLLIKGSSFGGGLISGDIISSAQFIIGTAATNTSQRFVYNSTSGSLLFDSDGSGSATAIPFATLNPKLALSFEDILVI
jgi:Ca2+-binding RTX toxin-like protein